MRNYSSKRAKRGKLAFRTPSRFIPHQILKTKKIHQFLLKERTINRNLVRDLSKKR